MHASPPLRIALLSQGGPFLSGMLTLFKERGLPPLPLYLTPPPEPVSRVAGLLEPIKKPARRLRRRLRLTWLRRQLWPLAYPIQIIPPLNHPRMVARLAREEVDVLLLSGVGILSEDCIRAIRQGVLNTHPGLLPWVRGTGVVARAVERQIPVGATLHYVDAGIDTGSLIERRLLPIPDHTTLDELEGAADRLCQEMMADAVQNLLSGHLPKAHTQEERFPYCRWPTQEERAAIASSIAEGKARATASAWQPLCVDHPGRLPQGAIIPPHAGRGRPQS